MADNEFGVAGYTRTCVERKNTDISDKKRYRLFGFSHISNKRRQGDS